MIFCKRLRLIITFYRSFCLVSLSITAFCLWTFWRYAFNNFFFIFWFKVATLALTFYFTGVYREKEFYYYRNLGLSKAVLWIATLGFDFLLYIFLLILLYNIR